MGFVRAGFHCILTVSVVPLLTTYRFDVVQYLLNVFNNIVAEDILELHCY